MTALARAARIAVALPFLAAMAAAMLGALAIVAVCVTLAHVVHRGLEALDA